MSGGVPLSGCPFCDDNLRKLGPPDICGGCSLPLWHVKVSQLGTRDWCDHDGHARVDRKNMGQVVATGHRTILEPHTHARCKDKRRERDAHDAAIAFATRGLIDLPDGETEDLDG